VLMAVNGATAQTVLMCLVPEDCSGSAEELSRSRACV